MKTFKDLVFEPKIFGMGGRVAHLYFDNGYGVSVIDGFGAYANDGEFEVAVLKNGNICYTTEITDDVLNNKSEAEVTEIMERIQKLEK